MTDFSKQLSKYLPAEAAPIISQWINSSGCQFKISRSRKSKLGDYRAPHRGAPHQISVNHDLNPFSFLITTVHEFAHLQTYNQFQHRVKPHGEEWKKNFQELMLPVLALKILPEDVTQALLRYLQNPAASSCTDVSLYRTLRLYDIKTTSLVPIESLAMQRKFALEDGRVFVKKEKLRKRFRCVEEATGRIYLFHPIAEVIPLE